MKKKEDVENVEKKGYMEVSPHCEFAPWRKTRSPPPSPVNMARNLHVDRTLVWSRSTIEYCSIDSMVLTEMEYVW